MIRYLNLVVGALLFASAALAQNAAGTLDGRVVDSSGAAIPGARVTIENQATNVKLVVPTNADGRFYERYLLPGTYTVSVEKPGFQRYVQSSIQLDVEQTIALTIPLKVGEVTTTVEVTANSAQLATETSTVATTLGSKAILDLPIQGRSPMSLATLVPGVIPSGGSNSPWISGGRNDYNDVTIDGTSVIVPENNVSHLQIGYLPIEDSVAEFSVVTNSLAPEYGRTGGGTINMCHARRHELTSTPRFSSSTGTTFSTPTATIISARNAPRGVVRYNQFGGTRGRPSRYSPRLQRQVEDLLLLRRAEHQAAKRRDRYDQRAHRRHEAGYFYGTDQRRRRRRGPADNDLRPVQRGPNAACPASQPICFRRAFANNVIPYQPIDPAASS